MASTSSFDRNDIMCPICLDIFIEPITLMCNHELCKQCYEDHFHKADFRCPMCKKRLNSWARKAASKGSLINKKKWDFIQQNFPDLIKKRLKGEDNFEVFQSDHICIAEKGEIHKEYIKAKLEWETEKKAEIDEEEHASFQLIQKILQEEKDELEQLKQAQIKQDQELAKVISKQLNQPISPNTVGQKLLRSTTSVKNRKKLAVPCNPITKYCVKRKMSEKENDSPMAEKSNSEMQFKSCKLSNHPAKRTKMSLK